jgi:hypothetical protein
LGYSGKTDTPKRGAGGWIRTNMLVSRIEVDASSAHKEIRTLIILIDNQVH